MSDPTAALAAHLELLDEWGIAGFSADPAWTTRRSPAPHEGDVHPVASEGEALGGSSGVTAGDEPDPTTRLTAIRDVLGDCTRCKLHRLGRTQIVFGVGNPSADLMFVGEGPGEEEDLQGLPFVGRSGQLLTRIIEAMGLRREDVYIANVVKCRPPGNRNPEPDEIATCEPFLFRQIDTIRPRVIVALGTFAARTLLGTTDPISRLRGRAYEFRGAKLIPTFHPAYLLRSPQYKRDTWEDMKLAMAILREPR